MNTSQNSSALVVTGDGSSTLQSGRHQETYHSTFGAVSESIEVFLTNSGVLERIKRREITRVLEIGFGTGLNFILTTDAALQYDCPLEYEALEYDLPPLDLSCELLHKNLPRRAALIEVLESYLKKQSVPPHCPALDINTNIKLNLRLENALQADLQKNAFHAIYLDAFSVKSTPDLWTAHFLARLKKSLKPDGILATYSVNRKFKDALNTAGYRWKKLKGPPGKREVIIASPAQEC